MAYFPSKREIASPSLSVTMAFFQLGRCPSLRPMRRNLPRTMAVLTLTTFTLKSCSMACLTSVLLALRSISKANLFSRSRMRSSFSVSSGRLMISKRFMVSLRSPWTRKEAPPARFGTGSCQHPLERGRRVPGEEQRRVAQDVVDVRALDGQELVLLRVAHGLEEVLVVLHAQHQRALDAQLGEGADRLPGARLRRRPGVHHHQRLVEVALADGGADGRFPHLLGHVVLVIAHLGRHRLAAADPLRGADGALARAPGALLLVGLLAAAGDQRAVLHAHRSGPARGELRLDHLVEEVLGFRAEGRVYDGVGKIDGADLLLLEVDDVDGGHGLALDLHVHARAQVELHQGVERLLGGLEDVEEPLVGADLELLARLLVHVRGAEHGELVDPRRQRDRSHHLRAGTLRRLDDLAGRLIEQLVVIRLQPDPDLLGRHQNLFSKNERKPVRLVSAGRTGHFDSAYAITCVTTPAPTVLPPSRMAKRTSFSIAMGIISSTSISMLSPGITISTPPGSLTVPVTSVVRK